MSSPTPHCDDSKLSVLLHGDEDSDIFQMAAHHVDSCPRCRERLTELAGESAVWDEFRSQLQQLPEASAQEPGADESSAFDVRRLSCLSPPTHPELLGRLGRYDVERAIGSGGMGIVLKAHDTELHRPVAIKLMAPHLAHSGAARQRFAREARAAAAVVHEHVIAIYDVVADSDMPYLVMQFVPGRSLQMRLDECGTLGVMEILRIGIQAALGLAAAHAQGLVHRDIKPANILLQDGVERITLTDFGLARTVDDATMTHSGTIAGTPQYMSPEQARGEPIDHRSDLFSLGSVMYAMCTGRAPFRAESTMGVLRRITDTEPHPIRDINAEIPVWLQAIIDRLLNKDPGQRIQTAAEVAQLLEGCLKHLQNPESAQLPAAVVALIDDQYPSQLKIDARRRWLAGALIATVLLGLVVWPTWYRWMYSSNSQKSWQKSATDSAKWDDGVAEQLEDLQDRINELEQTWP